MKQHISYKRPQRGSRPECDPVRPPERLDFHFPFPPRDRTPPPVYTPFLLIRSNVADQGDRPIDWMEFLEDNGSPDIRVTGPLGIPNLVPTPGEPHQISAIVHNRGWQDSAAAQVRFWAYQSLLGGDAVSELIGVATAFIPSRGSARVECPTAWTPTEGDLLSVMVDVSDPLADRIAVPFDPLLDRHVAQQIIIVESQPPGGDFGVRFTGGNLTLTSQPVTFEVRLRGGPAGAGISLDIEVGEASRYGGAPTLTYARRLLSVTGYSARRGRDGQRPAGVFTRTVTFEPGEMREVHVRGQLARNARAGQRFSLEVSQRIGPVVTGNAVIHLQVNASKAMAKPLDPHLPAAR